MSRASYLSPPDFHRLNWAVRPISAAFDRPVYLVGSVLRTADYRDIDLRLIVDDEQAAAYPPPVRLLLNIALSDLIARAAGLARPVDFQIQPQSEANTEPGGRNPLGLVGGWAVALSDAGAEGPYLADFVREPDARYLALLHPAFGKAVAAWLRVTASEMDAAEGTEYRALGDGHDFASWTAALAVARAILTGGGQ